MLFYLNLILYLSIDYCLQYQSFNFDFYLLFYLYSMVGYYPEAGWTPCTFHDGLTSCLIVSVKVNTTSIGYI